MKLNTIAKYFTIPTLSDVAEIYNNDQSVNTTAIVVDDEIPSGIVVSDN